MLKKLRIIFLIILAIMLLYAGMWFVTLIAFSSSINKQYANNYINVQSNSKEEPYFINFSKVIPYGFPFKFALRVVNWREEGLNREVAFLAPIDIGYDLLNQYLFISFSGEITGRFKPVERGFGVKFLNDQTILSIKIPLSFKLLKILFNQKNKFEVINLIQNVKFTSNKTEIFNLIDNQKLYDEAYLRLSATWENGKYYYNFRELLDNIPKVFKIHYATEILSSNIEDRLIPAGLLLYRPAWLGAFKFSGDLLLKINSRNFINLTDDLAIAIKNAKFFTRKYEGDINFLYEGVSDEAGDNKISLKLSTNLNLDKGAIVDLLNTVKVHYTAQHYLSQLNDGKNIYDKINKELAYLIENQDNFDFTPFERRQYKINFDANLFSNAYQVSRAQINELSLYSGRTGISLSNETKLGTFRDGFSKGTMVFSNYAKMIDVLSPYLYGLGEYKNISKESREVYTEALKLFIKAISDYPNSKSDSLSTKYKLNLTRFNKSKIGSVDDIEKIIPMYYLLLYQSAIAKVPPEKNLKEEIIKLVPDFNLHKKMLENIIDSAHQNQY